MSVSRALWQAVEDVRVSCEHGPDAGGASSRAIKGYLSWCESHGLRPDREANIEAMGRRAAVDSLGDVWPDNCVRWAAQGVAAEYPYTGTDPGVAIDAAEYAMEER